MAKAVTVRVCPLAPSFFACSRSLSPWVIRWVASVTCWFRIPSEYEPKRRTMLGEYLPIIIFLSVATAVGCVLLTLGTLLGPKKPGAEKLSPYECGFEAFEDARMKFDVRYYLVAILFILFDLEIAFLFPWATVLDSLPAAALVSFVTFIGLLAVVFVYVWKKGALEWE